MELTDLVSLSHSAPVPRLFDANLSVGLSLKAAIEDILFTVNARHLGMFGYSDKASAPVFILQLDCILAEVVEATGSVRPIAVAGNSDIYMGVPWCYSCQSLCAS